MSWVTSPVITTSCTLTLTQPTVQAWFCASAYAWRCICWKHVLNKWPFETQRISPDQNIYKIRPQPDTSHRLQFSTSIPFGSPDRKNSRNKQRRKLTWWYYRYAYESSAELGDSALASSPTSSWSWKSFEKAEQKHKHENITSVSAHIITLIN